MLTVEQFQPGIIVIASASENGLHSRSGLMDRRPPETLT
jgi:hypothetical protein